MRSLCLALILGLALCGSAASVSNTTHAQEPYIESGAEIYESVPRRAAIALAQLVQLYGWRCDSISAVTPFAFSHGFYVYCNNWRYSYEVEDRGGRWIVTVD